MVSLPDVCEVLRDGPADGPAEFLIELPHGATQKAHFAASSVTYFRGTGDSQARCFKPGETIDVGELPVALTIDDYNGDGFPDALVANELSGTVTYLQGEAAAGLSLLGHLEVQELPHALLTGDFNNDGFPDVVVASNGSDIVTQFRGEGRGLGRLFEQKRAERRPHVLEIADVDGDGVLDIVVSNGGVVSDECSLSEPRRIAFGSRKAVAASRTSLGILVLAIVLLLRLL